MRKVFFKSIILAIVLPMIPFTFTFADVADDFSAEISNSIKSKHLGLGMPFHKNPVNRTSFEIDKGDFSAGFILSRDLKAELFNEMDFYLSVLTEPQPGVELTFEYVQFFPRKSNKSWGEISGIGAILDFVNLPFTPSIYFARYFGYGNYFDVTFSKDFYLFKLPISGDGAFSYNHHAFRTGRGFSHLQTSLSIPLKFGRLEIKPKAIYCYPFSREFGEEFEIGVKMTYNFFD